MDHLRLENGIVVDITSGDYGYENGQESLYIMYSPGAALCVCGQLKSQM